MSAAIVPGFAIAPLAVWPTFFAFPFSGPEAYVGRPHQFRVHPQHSEHGQYPVVTTTYSRGFTDDGGRSDERYASRK